METISRLPRRLTQLYSDTKTSCDAVVEQDAQDTQPEINALHRKYRIQKDRLIAWGLEWSDNKQGKQGDIDESVERAGLTETVTSVLGTIKDILDEAEQMHPPVAHARAKALPAEKGHRPYDPPQTIAWAASERSRYEDLATDLTTSIDILYDLSRSRRTRHGGVHGPSPRGKAVTQPQKAAPASSVYLSPEYSASDVTLINPATLPPVSLVANTFSHNDLPPKLDPTDLNLAEEEPPPYETVGVRSSIRVIGKLRTRHSSTNPWKTEGSKTIETPVLVEYAAFDPAYRQTQVTPQLDRLESLLNILTQLSNEQTFHGTLNCLGYFEDPKAPRFGIVFQLPPFVYSGAADSNRSLEELRPVTLLNVLQTGSKALNTSNSATPPLEDRFRLAFTLARTFSKIHGDRFVHKDVNSSNILVFRKNRRTSPNSRALQFALRSPVICSFDLFSEYDIETTNTMTSPNIYRHPQDPKFAGGESREHGPQFDLYSLGLVLLEIGLWVPLSDLWKDKYTITDFKQRIEDVYIRRLASKCGTAYMQVVRDCFWAADRIASGAESLSNFSQVYNRILIRLQRCCLLDEVDPSLRWGDTRSDNLEKIPSGIQASETPMSPHRSAKQWALEKGTGVLERTKSLSKSTKSSPTPSALSRHGSQRSLHSVRKSITHLMSPKEEFSEPVEWHMPHHNALEDSAVLDKTISTGLTTPSNGATTENSLVLYRDEADCAASVIQRAWRASSTFTWPAAQKSWKEYKDRVTLIQKTWRQRKVKRADTLETLLAVATPAAMLGHITRTPGTVLHMDPEVQKVNDVSQNNYLTSSIKIDMDQAPKPKLRLQPVKFPPAIIDAWHETMLPRLERLIERALKDSDETISIDLVAIGETQATARPTIFVTCASVLKVRALLNRRFRYDESVFDLRVRRGKVRRSKMNRCSRRMKPPHRSMANTREKGGDVIAMNPFHQQRPTCGASIGAFRDEHLPPTSFGGIVLCNDEPVGMTVHHLLDYPSDEESGDDEDVVSPGPRDAVLSSARGSNSWLKAMHTESGGLTSPDRLSPTWDLEISDDDYDHEGADFSDYESETESEADSEGMTESHMTDGDIEGFDYGAGEDIKITQPAFDDVEDDFWPCLEDRDDDHLSSHELGYLAASSGIRRWNRAGIVHEIDWALFSIHNNRLLPYNLVQGGRRFCVKQTLEEDQREISSKIEHPICRQYYSPEEDEYPNGVVSADKLGGLRVHCFGRTTGLEAGMVGSAMSSLRIHQRKTFSRSWHVVGGFGAPGDSGAWVIENNTHHVVGHVLAWSAANRITYISPMEVMIEDMKRTLGAKRIYLPGSLEHVQYLASLSASEKLQTATDEAVLETSDEEDMPVIQGLGISDSAVELPQQANINGNANGTKMPARTSLTHHHLPLLDTTAGAKQDEKDGLVMRSKVLRVDDAGKGRAARRSRARVEVVGGA